MLYTVTYLHIKGNLCDEIYTMQWSNDLSCRWRSLRLRLNGTS